MVNNNFNDGKSLSQSVMGNVAYITYGNGLKPKKPYMLEYDSNMFLMTIG